MVNGLPVPNNSLVDLEDVLYVGSITDEPINSKPRQHNATLHCVTDLVDCCDMEELGNWFYPNGTKVDNAGLGFRSNRGQNELQRGHRLYGSVRLYRLYSSPIRGRFSCVLPDAENDNQTLYANIGMFN